MTIPTNRKVSVTKYTTPIFLVVSFIVIVVLLEYRRAVAGSFDGLKGGSQAGLALAYTGSLLLVAAQFYTIVKRSAWIGFIKTVGGVRPWLSIHITLSFIGLIAVLVHAGFPYRFNQHDPRPRPSRTDNLATRRFRGKRSLRTLHLQETACDEENLRLLETVTPFDNRTLVLRRDHSHDHSLRQLDNSHNRMT